MALEIVDALVRSGAFDLVVLDSVPGLYSASQAQEGFDRVRELKMLEFSIEALVLEQPWASLFTPRELEIARRRLASVGYQA